MNYITHIKGILDNNRHLNCTFTTNEQKTGLNQFILYGVKGDIYHENINKWGVKKNTTTKSIVGSYVNFSGKVREVRSIFFVRLKCVLVRLPI